MTLDGEEYAAFVDDEGACPGVDAVPLDEIGRLGVRRTAGSTYGFTNGLTSSGMSGCDVSELGFGCPFVVGLSSPIKDSKADAV